MPAAFLQLLKETGIRAGEAWQLEFTDIDVESRIIRVKPEKGSNPRAPRVSEKLLAMLLGQKKNSNRIFGSYALRGFSCSFQRQRKRIAWKLQNPRIKQITFHTFRHWKATMEYHRTKDILYVMKLLVIKTSKTPWSTLNCSPLTRRISLSAKLLPTPKKHVNWLNMDSPMLLENTMTAEKSSENPNETMWMG